LPKIDVKVEYDAIRVLINDALHLHVIRSKLLGVQSWERRPEGKFVIEYVMDGGTMTSDYDDREKWAAVLDGLKKALV
jgi:hypothetical protein